MLFKASCCITGASCDLETFGLKDHIQEPVCSIIPVIRKFPYNSWIFLLTYFYTTFLHWATNYELLYLSANTFGRVSMS